MTKKVPCKPAKNRPVRRGLLSDETPGTVLSPNFSKRRARREWMDRVNRKMERTQRLSEFEFTVMLAIQCNITGDVIDDEAKQIEAKARAYRKAAATLRRLDATT